MSHPDPLYNEDDMNYDDYNDFYGETVDYDDYNDDRDFDDENSGEIDWYDNGDDSMDGDAESAFGSCGWGLDEYYNPDNDYGDDW
jgi:hypothetical protein